MAYDEALAARIRQALGKRGGVTERKMFGGLAFMLRGNMFVGVLERTLMARVGPQNYESALASRGARRMDFTGKPMRGYVYVDASGMKSASDLKRWVGICADFASTLPAKAKEGAPGAAGKSPSQLIDKRIRELGGWRGKTLARMRALILEADPGIAEEWKWDVPVWSHDGIVCTGEAYTKVVKLTFAHGADIPDPSRLFNSSLEGRTRRAIDIHDGETVDPRAFTALVKAAVSRNGQAKKR